MFHTTDHTFRTESGGSACESFPNDFVEDTPVHSGDSSRFDCLQYLDGSDEIIEDSLPDTCPGEANRDPVFVSCLVFYVCEPYNTILNKFCFPSKSSELYELWVHTVDNFAKDLEK